MEARDELKSYVAEVREGMLIIRFASSLDSAAQSHDWARFIIKEQPGPFRVIRLDMTETSRLSSNFFAGLMNLHMHYTKQGAEKIVLVGVDRRTRTNLQILRLDGYFTFES
jgi:anti-anti-sigma regulatory factor